MHTVCDSAAWAQHPNLYNSRIPMCLLLESLPLTDVELSGYPESAVKFGTAVTFPCLRRQAHFQRVGTEETFFTTGKTNMSFYTIKLQPSTALCTSHNKANSHALFTGHFHF